MIVIRSGSRRCALEPGGASGGRRRRADRRTSGGEPAASPLPGGMAHYREEWLAQPLEITPELRELAGRTFARAFSATDNEWYDLWDEAGALGKVEEILVSSSPSRPCRLHPPDRPTGGSADRQIGRPADRRIGRSADAFDIGSPPPAGLPTAWRTGPPRPAATWRRRRNRRWRSPGGRRRGCGRTGPGPLLLPPPGWRP